MADMKELVRQIGTLAEELSRAVEEELEATGAETRAKITELTAGFERVCAERDAALGGQREVERELAVAEKRIETLVDKLKDARQAAAEAGEEAQRALRRQLDALQGECDDARAELDKERAVRKRLEKAAAADEKRLSELAKASQPGAGAVGAEFDRLQGELTEARESAGEERQARQRLETDLAAATEKVQVLEQALKNAAAPALAGGDAGVRARVEECERQLRTVEADLAAEQQLCRRYARECAEAQKRVAELESRSGQTAATPIVADKGVADARPAADKPLPHELRPAPKPGVLFRPDWDLQSLPCASAEQILQAWSSVSNVQLSLEGYPSQYCSAYLVVVKQGKQKQLYLLFNLKGLKHLLVCVPATPPKDEAALAKLLGEGQKYLQMSGFDLEKLAPADIPRRMGHYLQG
jgi:hypothetical protein